MLEHAKKISIDAKWLPNAINTDIDEAGNLAKQGANIASKTI